MNRRTYVIAALISLFLMYTGAKQPWDTQMNTLSRYVGGFFIPFMFMLGVAWVYGKLKIQAGRAKTRLIESVRQ